MCGICGKLNFDPAEAVRPAVLRSMADAIVHRGPDDEGYYVNGQVGFGFRRLSIIDLRTGHQPIPNEDKTVWIVFNGEIYNYQELRALLQSKGHVFKTRTDTEVIVHLYEEYGSDCVEKLRGMFGFAIWDARMKTLFLARDRVGIKPLYYWSSARSLVFGSEIKAILADPDVRAELKPEMIDRFLTFLYMPGEETLFDGIYKLPPGCSMSVTGGRITIRKYWDLKFNPVPRSLKRAKADLLDIFDESVQLHMISDVPVGFLLSGGVDSTAVLGFAAGKTKHPLSSYTLGFDAIGITDERPYAKLAAEAYGSEHHDLSITYKEFQDFLPKYVWYMEEPVCEPPAIALYFVSKLARNYVKVLLSGEGGDEAFAGYQNYRTLLWLERIKAGLGPLNRPVSTLFTRASRMPGFEKLRRFSPLLTRPFHEYYFSRTASPVSFFNAQSQTLYTKEFGARIDKEESLRPLRHYMKDSEECGILHRMLYIDTKAWLTDDLLLKADKMTMANSIELRVPLLDHKLLEFAASLPANFKVRRFTTKYIAKKALSSRVPQAILDRRKTGFPVPYNSWLRNEMKGWVNDVLLDRAALNRGYFQTRAIEKLLVENQRSGKFSKEVFSLAMLEMWHRMFVSERNVLAKPMESSATHLAGARHRNSPPQEPIH